jgi:hypothetical protein
LTFKRFNLLFKRFGRHFEAFLQGEVDLVNSDASFIRSLLSTKTARFF